MAHAGSKSIEVLTVESEEQQSDPLVFPDIAEASVHPVAIVVRPDELAITGHPDETWFAALKRTIDALR